MNDFTVLNSILSELVSMRKDLKEIKNYLYREDSSNIPHPEQDGEECRFCKFWNFGDNDYPCCACCHGSDDYYLSRFIKEE